jgi:hypothetical protein
VSHSAIGRNRFVSRGELPFIRIEVSSGNTARTQSTTATLHEAAQHSWGLVVNFHEVKVVDGVSRMILPGANQSDF